MNESKFFRLMGEYCTTVIENAQEYPRIQAVMNQVKVSRERGCYSNIDWMRAILIELALVSGRTYRRIQEPDYEVSRELIDGVSIVFGLGEERWKQLLAAAGYLFRPDNTKDNVRRDFVIKSHEAIRHENPRKNMRAFELLVECNEALRERGIEKHLFSE